MLQCSTKKNTTERNTILTQAGQTLQVIDCFKKLEQNIINTT